MPTPKELEELGFLEENLLSVCKQLNGKYKTIMGVNHCDLDFGNKDEVRFTSVPEKDEFYISIFKDKSFLNISIGLKGKVDMYKNKYDDTILIKSGKREIRVNPKVGTLKIKMDDVRVI